MISRMKVFAPCISLGACLIFAIPVAQGQAYIPASKWGFEFSPDVWGTSTQQSAPNNAADAEAPDSFASKVEDLKPSVMAEAIFRYERAFIAVDGTAVDISGLSTATGEGTPTEMIESAPRAGIDVLRVGNGYFEPFRASITGGARYLRLSPGFVNQSTSGGTTKTQFEPLLGSDLVYRMSSRWALRVKGDVSRGIRTNVIPSWEVYGGFEVSVGSRSAFRLGYREAHLQLQADSLPPEASVTGPTFGISIRLGHSGGLVR